MMMAGVTSSKELIENPMCIDDDMTENISA